MQVEFLPIAREQLHKFDKNIQGQILTKIYQFSTDQKSGDVKSLKEEYSGSYRLRVGNYRIIFSVKEDSSVTIMFISKVGHRKDIYRK